MKKNSIGSRMLALLLALTMVVSMIPAAVFAANIGDLGVGNPGIDTSTLGKEGFINWPVKIYDYLDDGLLFETSQATVDSTLSYTDSYYYGSSNLYGGGAPMPVTKEGCDFTGAGWHTEAIKPWVAVNFPNRFTATTITPNDYTKSTTTTDDDAFVNPRFVRVTPISGSTNSAAFCVKNFRTLVNGRSTDYAVNDNVRYMVIVYRSVGLSNKDDLTLWIERRTDFAYLKPSVTWEDSSKWTARVFDLKSMVGTTAWDNHATISATYLHMPSLDSTDRLDISHVAFFNNEFEARQYGIDAAAFSNNPGELLSNTKTLKTTSVNKYTLPAVDRPDYVLSSRYRYYSDSANKYTDVDENVVYGQDFTLAAGDTTNGQYTTVHSSATYWTWVNGETITLKYDGISNSYDMNQMKVEQKTETKGQRYIRLSNVSGNSSANRLILTKFREDTGEFDAPLTSDVNYAVLVYRTNGMSSSDKYGFWAHGYTNGTTTQKLAAMARDVSTWATNNAYINPQSYEISDGRWVYDVVDLTTVIKAKDSDMNSLTRLKRLGLYLPALTNGKSLDLAYVAYFGNATEADYFGAQGAAYMNAGKTITVTGASATLQNRNWNGGNNNAFGLLYSSSGGGWTNGIYGGGYNSTATNCYYTYRIGYNMYAENTATSNVTRQDLFGNSYTATYTDANGKLTTPTSGTTNNIFYVWGSSTAGEFDLSKLDLDGYQILSTLTHGGMTAGLLEGKLENGMPVYRQETVEYVAKMLYNTLTIPMFDADGDYNYNYVTGSASSQFGGFDLNGDGKLGKADLNGDNYYETDENSVNLATALRGCLGIRFVLGTNRGTNPVMGSYRQTAQKSLIGEFKKVRNNITTCMDAAYFLLNNIFNANAYSQQQNDYSYLKLDHATMSNGKTAYVFDAGFSTGSKYNNDEDGHIGIDKDYEANSQSAVKYDPYVRYDKDGNKILGTGVISLDNVNSKDMFYYGENSTTTRFPFLPVTDAEGDYAGATAPYYFLDPGVTSLAPDRDTYTDRNFNYAMVSNGEFVYHEEDGLFFEFEGDDDVYLFINNQLVLDIGGAHSITTSNMEVNDYVFWAREVVENVEAKNGDYAAAGYTKAQYDRALALDLTEGEICSFDFYYMERHGYGANCRIVTNMRITDPDLQTDKTAKQFGEDIPYGGVVDHEAPIEYNFSLLNTGNTKLYNLTFEDKDIGVKIDYEKGLQVTGTYKGDNVNGYLVTDSYGGPLEAKDLSAYVVGYEFVGTGGTHNKYDDGKYVVAADGDGMYRYAEVPNITFKDNQALINFMKLLQADGTMGGEIDAELTQNGAGLWVDALVVIKGIYYSMNDDQVKKGYFDNTVYVTATTRSDPTDADNQTLRSSANHRIYVSGNPVYYQWADHEIYLKKQMVVEDAAREAGTSQDSQLSQYKAFFDKITDENDVVNMNLINIKFCDKNGRAATYNEVTNADANGWLVNYKTSGTYAFYLYLSLKNDTADGKAGIQDGEYAIVRVTIYVTDVEDSTYVLDYGLKTENLDAYGELFKNDQLLGTSEGTLSKLMAIATSQPSYRDYTNNKSGYNRINFNPFTIPANGRIWTKGADGKDDGYFTMNLEIPGGGREISYNANTGSYSLTDVGTVTVHVDTPPTWTDVYLYWWYDNGVCNATFPGQQMSRSRPSKFTIDIPANVPHVIVSRPAVDADGNVLKDSNGNVIYQQTSDLNLSMGQEAWIKLNGKLNDSGNLAADVYYSVEITTMHAVVPSDWNQVYLYYWNETGIEGEDYPAWPGTQMTDEDGDGIYSLGDVPGNMSHVIVNNGGVRNEDKQTKPMSIYAGKETTIAVKSTFDATVEVTKDEEETNPIPDTYKVTVKAHSNWGDNIHLYCWNDAGAAVSWPGTPMTKNDDGTYSLEISSQYAKVIINNNGGMQTADLMLRAGENVYLELDENKAVTSCVYEGTFDVVVTVPSDWGDNINLYYWSDKLGTNNGWPGTAMTKNSDGTFTLTGVNTYVTHLIVNNGSAQTSDFAVNVQAGDTLYLTVNEHNNISKDNRIMIPVSVVAPSTWDEVWVYYWSEDGTVGVDYPAWPGVKLSDTDGVYKLVVSAGMDKLIINDGTDRDVAKQTGEVQIPDEECELNVTVKEVLPTSSIISATATNVDTITVTVQAPASWGDINLYCWNAGTDDNFGAAWPGTAMTPNGDGTYSLEISANATHVVINHPVRDEEGNVIVDDEGNASYVQTNNIPIVTGKNVSLTVDDNGAVSYDYSGTYTVNIKVPASWGANINLYWCNDDLGLKDEWPGAAMTKNSDGTYTIQVPNYATKLVVNNIVDGQGVQSNDLWVGSCTAATIEIVEQYDAVATYPKKNVMVHAKVPSNWVANGEKVYLYAWDSNRDENAPFPGVEMTLGEDGWYNVEMYDTYTNVAISNGSKQSVNLTIRTGLEPWITVNDATVIEEGDTRYTASVGNGNSTEEDGFYFTPVDFMDNKYELWMAITVHATKNAAGQSFTPTALGDDIDVHSEVQMYKKVTVLPANVVYYEDDFSGISYPISGNDFSYIGGGSGSLKQDVDQDREYGQDSYYQGGDNNSISGNSTTRLEIVNTNAVAHFTFSGTGFEIIGRTNAMDAGTIMVKVYNAAEYAAYLAGTTKNIEPYMQIPVIQEYDNGANGGSDSIEQVPVVRVDTISKLVKDANGFYVVENGQYKTEALGYGTYAVEISGVPVYDFSNWNGGDKLPPVAKSYLYIDGVRVFNPYVGDQSGKPGQSGLYNPGESGAAFGKIHDMIANKQMFVISTTEDGALDENGIATIKVSGGMNTWTENRIGVDSTGAAWSGSTVSNITEYLYAGPNNEAYLASGDGNPSALAFYVQDGGTKNGLLQVAVRGIDRGTFFGGYDSALNATLLLGVVNKDGTFGWKTVATVVSGTEQYYSIPYTECPYDAANGRYQVVIKVVDTENSGVSGMVSFTSVKTNGLTIPTLSGDQYELTYSYDTNALTNRINGEELDGGEYVNYAMIAKQMRSNAIVQDEDSGSSMPEVDRPLYGDGGSDDTGSDNTGSDNTGSDNTGSDNTGSDNTGSDEVSPGTGDVSLMGLVAVMVVAMMTVVAILPKKAFRA